MGGISWSPDRREVAFGDLDGWIVVVNIWTGRKRRVIRNFRSRGGARDLQRLGRMRGRSEVPLETRSATAAVSSASVGGCRAWS
jgi:hypothetical protein